MLEHIPTAVAEIINQNRKELFSPNDDYEKTRKSVVEYTDELTRTMIKAFLETTKRYK